MWQSLIQTKKQRLDWTKPKDVFVTQYRVMGAPDPWIELSDMSWSAVRRSYIELLSRLENDLPKRIPFALMPELFQTVRFMFLPSELPTPRPIDLFGAAFDKRCIDQLGVI